MSLKDTTQLPDLVQGSASVQVGDSRSLRVSSTASKVAGGVNLLHAHIGNIYIAMSEQNWRILFAALSELKVEVQPRNFRIIFDDDNGEAKVVTA